MAENQSTSDIPKEIIDKVSKERNLAGFSVKQIDKTGSSLHLLESDQNKGIVRNGEIPAKSMAVWEFLHSHAHTIIQPAIAQRVFGPWGKAQVAPILEKDGENRVHYGETNSRAYSQMVGLNTEHLAAMLNISEVQPYYFQKEHLHESRWLDSTSFHLAKDVFAAFPSLDSDHRISDLYEDYWREFSRLNSSRISRIDLLKNKELRRQDMDADGRYLASIKLVEIGHQISKNMADLYRKLEHSEDQSLWKSKPTKDIILFLTHLTQTSTQQSILWWLGISHGHLHMYNSVSKLSTEGSPEAEISPLITSVIDFDNARTVVPKLEESDELYQSIDAEAVKAKVMNPNLDINVRLQLAHYLPLKYWDEDTIKLIKSRDDSADQALIKLISARVGKDVVDHNHYSWLTQLVYELEKKDITEDYPVFDLTLPMLRKQPERITTDNQDISIVANYFRDDELPKPENLTIDQNTLLLSAIYELYRGEHIYEPLNFTSKEMSFIMDQSKLKNLSGNHARQLLANMATDYNNEDVLNSLFQLAKSGDTFYKDFLSQVINSVTGFTISNHPNFKSSLYFMMNSLAQSNNLEYAFSLINFKEMSKDQIEIIKDKVINDLYLIRYFEDKSEARSQMILNFTKQTNIALGKKYRFVQSAKRMFKRKK